MNSKSAAVLLTADAKADDREQRLAELFDNHEARLYRLARRLAENADDAHDLVQETFVRAASSLRSIPVDPAKGEAWLVRVLVNIRRDQWRQTAVRRRSAATLAASSDSAVADIESALHAKRAVWAALGVLQPRRRAIVVMHELEGQTPVSIAQIFGVSVLTVRWHLSMARRDLKRLLQPFMKGTP